MAGKVIHIDDHAHKLAKEYCRKHSMSMSILISQLIKRHCGKITPVDIKIYSDESEPVIKLPQTTTLPQVENTTLPPTTHTCKTQEEEEEDPWTRPPFWVSDESPAES